jgi:Flp pilus assembly pilin Flp
MEVFTNLRNRIVLSVADLMTGGASREDGQTFVEYALILAVIGAGIVVALTFLQGKISALYGQIIADVPWNS